MASAWFLQRPWRTAALCLPPAGSVATWVSLRTIRHLEDMSQPIGVLALFGLGSLIAVAVELSLIRDSRPGLVAAYLGSVAVAALILGALFNCCLR